MMNNVYAWMLQQNQELMVKLLKGERVELLKHTTEDGVENPIFVSLLLDGWYALKDYIYFECWYGNKQEKMGGVDQSLGGCITFPWEDAPDEELTAQNICTDALDKVFHLYELEERKDSISCRAAFHDETDNTYHHHGCKERKPELKHKLFHPEVLDKEPLSPVAIDVYCASCGKLIGWVNSK